MSVPYAFSIILNQPFDDAVSNVRAAFAAEGFGVVTEMDVQHTLNAKLGLNMPPYTVLGMCNPGLASRAIDVQPEIGVMLPCNVMVRSIADGAEVLVQDPEQLMKVAAEPALEPIAQEAGARIKAALNRLA